MWSWYGVHITVCMSLFICVLCQPVHSLTLYISQISFRNIFMETCFCSFLIVIHTLQQHCSTIIIFLPTYQQLQLFCHYMGSYMLNKNGVQQGRYIAQSGRCSKQTVVLNQPSLGNIHMIDGCFICVTSHIKVLDWLEKKKEEEEKFWILIVSGRPPQNSFSSAHSLCYCRLGQHIYKLL